VNYLPPFDLIKQLLTISTVKGQMRVKVPYDDFLKLLRLLIAGTEVDEKWYLQKYEDIREAVEAGKIPSAKKHFVNDGYFEGRLPFPLDVDEEWYLSHYPDVAEGISSGAITSAKQHFTDNGYREGRLPIEI